MVKNDWSYVPMINSDTSNSFLIIDLEALASNYRFLQSHVGSACAVSCIIKANAYGVGANEVAAKLKTLKCPQFFVATLEEALQIRRFDHQTPIAVLNGFLKGTEKEYLEHNILPVLNSLCDIEQWQQLSQQNKKQPAILHFDTGMNRLGLSALETRTFLENENSLDVQMVMSHFSCADNKEHPLTSKQAEIFSALVQKFPTAQRSLANSSGIFRDKHYHYDMVRPGYALYGGNPTPETKNPMKPVVSLFARILQIRDCQTKESIGYGATHVFDKNTRTATISIGYADSFFRSNNPDTVLYYEGQPCPVLGRISMDLVSIDITHIQGKRAEQGDLIEILGSNQTIDDLAKTTGTIGYEILTSLGQRYERKYI